MYQLYIPPTPPPRRRCPPVNLENAMPTKTLSLKMLSSECPRQELPLDVHIASTSLDDDHHVVYHCTLTSVTTNYQWTISYRYSEFYAFKTKIMEVYTCHSDKCAGSCQAIRDYVTACFPRKRLLGSSAQAAIEERKLKLENVLLHLLRCTLLPGSAMKCSEARCLLPTHLFEFLGVRDEADRRSLLQIYVDNYQEAIKRCSMSSLVSSSSTLSSGSSMADTQCMICLEDVDLDHDVHTHYSDNEHNGSECEADGSETGVILPCNHVFHRECIFQWLMFQYQCPLCRSRVGPPAVTNYCRAKHRVQWWLADFEEDPLHLSF